MTESMPFHVPSFRIESAVCGHRVYKASWSLHRRRAVGSIKLCEVHIKYSINIHTSGHIYTNQTTYLTFGGCLGIVLTPNSKP